MADRLNEGCLGENLIKKRAADAYRMAVWRKRIQVYLPWCRTCLPEPECRLCCGVCTIADFSDDDMNDLLKLEGVERFEIYVATENDIDHEIF